MRRLLLSVAASALVVALVPTSAFARGHHHKHSRHHHARVHKSKIRHKRFGNITTPPATTPAPTTPGAPPTDAVGKIATFDGTKLTITLNDGTTTVSGKVTPDTEIECESMQNESSGMSHHDDGDGGDHQGGGGPQGGGDDQGGGADNGDNDQDDQGQNNNNQCTTANLTPGTFIRGAELGISSAGAVWEKVDLIL